MSACPAIEPSLPCPLRPRCAVKHCVKLQRNAAYRRECGTAVVVGRDLVDEISSHTAVRRLLFVSGAAPPPGAMSGAQAVAVTEAVMQKVTGLDTVGAGVVAAEVEAPEPADFWSWKGGRLRRLLVLERCQDPGNLVGGATAPASQYEMQLNTVRAILLGGW
jgi:tRNA G18 (ribose-2'-O)-methylase SpoU